MRRLAAALLLVLAAPVAAGCGGDERIADGVTVGLVDVGGLQAQEARAKLAPLAPAVRRPVVLTYRSQRFVLHPERANVSLDVAATVKAAQARDDGGPLAPRVYYPRAKLEAFVGRVARRVDKPARDADIDVRDGKLSRTRARAGREVRRPQLLAAVTTALAQVGGERSLEIPVRVTERADRNLDDLAERYPTVIAVDRDAKQLRLYKDLRLEHKYTIAVGKAGLETAAGRYKIVEKIVDPPWHVPDSDWAGDLAGRTIAPDDPQNPLEARWLGFHDGQGIHGTDDVSSLGTAASHGCIRMAVRDVEQLYGVVPKGTPLFLQ
ncbi:MAG TPA: L,D-transpeptidase family protein [Solirubrobacteraceae bacterium]|nr:L,D-transpeptidase family protein [Solirubrobacteraceae bacterium]